ncbi:hypothetical protein A2U01_0090134, partial [Trifolium medium]|nr:hypothetical protein [Trifolium medium]
NRVLALMPIEIPGTQWSDAAQEATTTGATR